MKVRVQSVEVKDLYTKAGIMARAHLGANAANVFALLMPTEKGHRMTVRRTDGAGTESIGSGPQVPPNSWLRLQRVGDVFSAYRSMDGTTWTLMKSAAIVLPQTVYLGLAATSHNDTVTTLAEFRAFGNTSIECRMQNDDCGMEKGAVRLSFILHSAFDSDQPHVAPRREGMAEHPAHLVVGSGADPGGFV